MQHSAAQAGEPESRSRILVAGYYGFDNAGDEAILYALVQGLRRRRPHLDLTVLSADPPRTAAAYGVRAAPRRQTGALFREMRRCDLFVMGGGGLLQDTTSLASLQYYLGLVALARACGKRTFFYAQGIGPVRSGLGRQMTRMMVNRVEAVTVRDEESRRELAALGVRRPRVRVTADPVLGLEWQQEWLEQGRALLEGLGLGGGTPVVGISVRPWAAAEGYIRTVAEAADRLAGEGWRVLFLPFHHPGDLEMSRQAAALMKAPAVIMEKPCDFKELIGICAHLDLAVGMRLHFLVFAALAGVPLVGLPYDPKVSRFLGRLGLETGTPGVISPEDLGARLAGVLADPEAVRAVLRERVAALRRAADQTNVLCIGMLDRQRGCCV